MYWQAALIGNVDLRFVYNICVTGIPEGPTRGLRAYAEQEVAYGDSSRGPYATAQRHVFTDERLQAGRLCAIPTDI